MVCSCLVWSILCLLTYYRGHVSFALTCKPGQKATPSRDGCVPCPDRQYNNKQTQSRECRNCDPCEFYSFEVAPCKPTSNTECRCHKGFSQLDSTNKRCICPKGLGIKTLENGDQICEKCPPNMFTNHSNSICQPLPDDQIPGSTISDVSYRTEAKTVVASSSPLLLSMTSTSTTTITPTTSRNFVSTPTTPIPKLEESKKHALRLASLTVFLLVILILKFSRCCNKKTKIVRQGSACGKPVEESGEKFLPPLQTSSLHSFSCA